MRHRTIIVTSLIAASLVSCGSPAEPPVEQIVIREPGEAARAADDTTGDPDDGAASAGQAAFISCAVCHTVDPDAASGVGPSLYGVVGRPAAALSDFEYSVAMTNSSITWDAAQLEKFLADPTNVVPGTSMSAGAVSDEDRRRSIIAYLSDLSEQAE